MSYAKYEKFKQNLRKRFSFDNAYFASSMKNLEPLFLVSIDDSTKDTMKTSSSETILHGLKKYTNYSMAVLAYTSGGDGVMSSPIHCQTEQDGELGV